MIKDYPLYIFILNYALIFIQLFSILWIFIAIFELTYNKKQFFQLQIVSLLYSALLMPVYYIVDIGSLDFNLIVCLYENAIKVLTIMIVYRDKKKEVVLLWPIIGMYSILWESLLQCATIILQKYIEITLFSLGIIAIVSNLFLCVLTFLSFKLLIRTNYLTYFKIPLEFPRMCIIWLFLFFASTIYSNVVEVNTFNYLMLTLLMAVSILFCMVTARDYSYKQRLKQSEALILQQESYVKRLESIQKELRLIQHDYKNMIAGLYTRADAGDAESIKTFIRNKLLNVDASVQENINQMNQVAKIGLAELRGLVLTKLLLAEEKGVRLNVEAMNTISNVAMDIEDLLRCVGILLDNAIEAVENMERPEITLVLLMEADKLTIAVKNPTQRKPDLSKIWQDGYSTKGESRGLGLTSYKKILHKYPNIYCETKVTDNTFLQVMIVSHVKNDKL